MFLTLLKNELQIMPPTARVEGLRFGSGPHGYSSLEGFLPMSLTDGIFFSERAQLADVRIVDKDGRKVWRGRVEDVASEGTRVRIQAFGYAKAMNDLLYTALWSVTGTANWRGVSDQEVSTAANDRYELDTNNRLYIAVKKDEISSDSKQGQLVYELPDRGSRDALVVSGDVDMAVSDGNTWVCNIQAYDESWAALGSVSAIGSTSSSVSASWSFSAPAGTQIVVVRFYRDVSVGTAYTGETGDTYTRLTNLRIKTTTSTTVVASEIVTALVADAAAINAGQVEDSSVWIEPTTGDLSDEIYEDMRHAEILNRLATRERYWWGVWDDKRLFFVPEGTGGRELVVDVAAIRLEGSLEPLINRAYATYTEAGGRVRRTAVANETDSQETAGLIRMGMVQAETTSETEAERWRDALLADRSDYPLRADIEFDRVYTENQIHFPLAAVRAGDVITMRNLPTTIEGGLVVRSFRVAVCEFDAMENRLRVEPDSPTPTLVTLIAKRGT